ncbi:MAG: 16S rRNA (guanine(527)-N(7))-methyltransferase RsmG [Candidatus Abyssobacteria bacterium SURF_5]|uniref:Ribosomal RNA small subunit methyltransferase G n=1 Tax=Abyssobacteria bacterium (strain SURF_5) TaxID=2093360 RepID=A0A3A4P680_ABYX5|nr:MAG: 16S rRNA (guanine(527)-N(7))-methyltransferase RsmG [Candidatus Abyssubacteria bacterium SURF_5]
MATDDIDLFRDSLAREAARLRLPLPEPVLDSCAAYYRLLARWNARLRLVGSTEPGRAACELFADSFVASSFAGEFLRVPRMIDIGAGAGFPGMAVKLLHPERPLACIEAITKKTSFLKTLRRALSLDNVDILAGRAERCAHEGAFRERFDLAFCRAVASPAAAIELGTPFIRVGGMLVLQAGALGADEIESVSKAAGETGASLEDTMSYDLSCSPRRRLLLRIKKTCPTPAIYPRSMNAIRRRPLA